MRNLIDAILERKTVEKAEVKNNILVAIFKSGRQYSAKCLAKRLEKNGFTTALRSRVLAVQIPEDEERVRLLAALLEPRKRDSVEKVAEELVAELEGSE